MVIMDQRLDLWAKRVTVEADREELYELDLILFFKSSYIHMVTVDISPGPLVSASQSMS